MIHEIDGMLRVDAGGVILSEGEAEVSYTRLEEWLRTPMGSVYGLPSWGNPLKNYKHEPIGSTTSFLVEVAIENALIQKLRVDLPGIKIMQIRCEAVTEDMLGIWFVMPSGEAYFPLKKNS